MNKKIYKPELDKTLTIPYYAAYHWYYKPRASKYVAPSLWFERFLLPIVGNKESGENHISG